MSVHAQTTIKVDDALEIGVWASMALSEDAAVCIEIISKADNNYAYLTADQVDELIRALAAARVELSKARP